MLALSHIFDILANAGTTSSASNPGEFFSHFAFGALGSVILSAKIREWVIPPISQKYDNWITEIDHEIDEVRAFAQKDDDFDKEAIIDLYRGCRKKATGLKETLVQAQNIIHPICYVITSLCISGLICIICTHADTELGAWNLAFLSHLLIARGISKCIGWRADTSFNNDSQEFYGLRDKYQNKYSSERNKTRPALNKFINEKDKSSK